MKTSESLDMSDLGLALLNRARRFCASAEQCSGDVRRKLADWGAAPDEVAPIVARLCDEGYLDDRRYARAYCESKLLRGGWGRQKVAYHLRMKGVDAEVVAAGMAAVDDESYRQELEEAAQKKWRELCGRRRPTDDGEGDDETWEERQALRRKLTAFLVQRGYEMNEINQVITNILKR